LDFAGGSEGVASITVANAVAAADAGGERGKVEIRVVGDGPAG